MNLDDLKNYGVAAIGTGCIFLLIGTATVSAIAHFTFGGH